MAPDLSWESVQGLGGQRLPGAVTGVVRVSPLHVLPPSRTGGKATARGLFVHSAVESACYSPGRLCPGMASALYVALPLGVALRVVCSFVIVSFSSSSGLEV